MKNEVKLENLISPLDKDFIINNTYQCLKKLSSGSFGTVYSGINIQTKEEVAVKVEKIQNEEMRSVFREVQFLKRLENIKGVPKVYWSGSIGNYDIMVITLLGKDLASFLKIYHKFSLKTVILLADQILSILEEVHNAGIVHRDLKPENLVMGRGENNNQVYLIDFGISKVYRDAYGRHIPWRDKKSFIGTARYASCAAHEGIEISRKDDLESLSYVLLFILKGSVPWQNLNISEKEKCKKVGEIKASLKPEELFKTYPEEFSRYISFVRGMSFKQTPDYNFLKGLFIKLAMNRKYIIDNVFDWSLPKKTEIISFKKNEGDFGKSYDALPKIKEKPPLQKGGSNQNIKNNIKITSLEDIEEKKIEADLLKVPSKNQLDFSQRSGAVSIGGSLAMNFDNSLNNIIDADLSLFLFKILEIVIF